MQEKLKLKLQFINENDKKVQPTSYEQTEVVPM